MRAQFALSLSFLEWESVKVWLSEDFVCFTVTLILKESSLYIIYLSSKHSKYMVRDCSQNHKDVMVGNSLMPYLHSGQAPMGMQYRHPWSNAESSIGCQSMELIPKTFLYML